MLLRLISELASWREYAQMRRKLMNHIRLRLERVFSPTLRHFRYVFDMWRGWAAQRRAVRTRTPPTYVPALQMWDNHIQNQALSYMFEQLVSRCDAGAVG